MKIIAGILFGLFFCLQVVTARVIQNNEYSTMKRRSRLSENEEVFQPLDDAVKPAADDDQESTISPLEEDEMTEVMLGDQLDNSNGSSGDINEDDNEGTTVKEVGGYTEQENSSTRYHQHHSDRRGGHNRHNGYHQRQ